jgi:hypothetical protein
VERFHIFPWREEESLLGTGQRIVRPTVDVTLSHADLDITTKALIDTGAPRCVFPRGVADALAIEFPKPWTTNFTKVHLLGQEWKAITVTLSLQLPPFDDLGWDTDVDIVAEEGLPFGLLGYEGFLNRWVVSVNGYHSYFVIEPLESFEGRLPAEPLEEFRRRFPGSYQA